MDFSVYNINSQENGIHWNPGLHDYYPDRFFWYSALRTNRQAYLCNSGFYKTEMQESQSYTGCMKSVVNIRCTVAQCVEKWE